MPEVTEAALEARARRAARSAGLVARKSRWRLDTLDNYGGFNLVDPEINAVIGGGRYEWTAEEIIEYCRHDD